jgi:hypothetical protein
MDDRTFLAQEFRRRWPDVDLVQVNQPFRGLAVRFQNSVYAPEDETIPEVISAGVQEISLQVPDVRFVLLRTECWGGECSNWGQFIQYGQRLVSEPPMGSENGGVLRRLLLNLNVDIGPSEIFEPLSRDFPWKAGQ